MPTDRERSDEDARRAYWRRQMDAACDFMNGVLAHPVRECGEAMVSLRDVASKERLEVLFSDTKLADKHERVHYLRERLIEDFIAVSRQMNLRGWVLKVEDAYRTRAMQASLATGERVFDVVLQRVLWEQGDGIPTPELMFRRLSALVAARPKSGTHMSGTALDVSVFERRSGREVDRGGPYLELSELTPMDSPFISREARENRRAITSVMAGHGFVAYPYEFWHYSSGDAFCEYLARSGRPARYGAVEMDPSTGRTTPMDRQEDPLHSLEEVRRGIDEVLKRRIGQDHK